MYKIYINETPVYLISNQHALQNESSGDTALKSLVLHYKGKKKLLLQVIDMLEKGNYFNSVLIFCEEQDRLWEDFKSLFKVLMAAGGVVFNNLGQILIIFRRGKWDLPKGKVEEGETIDETALREVEEETGLTGVQCGPFIMVTFHIYREEHDKRILKATHWYRMTSESTSLVLQNEEDIEEGLWVSSREIHDSGYEFYGNIRDVLNHVISPA
jgi:8-oxo-dGTP pyrophosphatase MutT (NUDIX family)